MIGASDLTATWDQYADRLLLIARSMGESAEDAVQEAFIVLARQPEMPDNPLAWLVSVCRNLQRESYRREKRRRAREARAGRPHWFDRDVSLIDSQLDAGAVTETLMRLSSPTREIIVMRVWGEMTFESIAEVVELSRATVHREFHDGLRQLKRNFDSEPQPESMRLCHE